MANFSAAASRTGMDMGSNNVFYGTITAATAQRITIVAGYARQDYTGSFTYNADAVSGTLTGTSFSDSYTGHAYNASGFATDAAIAAAYIQSGNTLPLITSVLSQSDTITGSQYNDRLFGFAGNDRLISLGGNDYLDGGAGVDTAMYSGTRGSYNYSFVNGVITVADRTGLQGTDTMTNVERLSFADGNVAFDINGNAGQAYRLYQAALDRKPDMTGLGAQINGLDSGMSLQQISQNFINAAEFGLKYGAGLSNEAFVTQLYANVLHRAPDAGGFAVQVNALNTGMSHAQLLVNFSESPENYQATLVGIQNGIEYVPVA